MLTVIMPEATILSVEFSNFYADCHFADWGISNCIRYNVIMQSIIMLSMVFSDCYAEWYYAERGIFFLLC